MIEVNGVDLCVDTTGDAAGGGVSALDLQLPGVKCVAQRLALDPVGHGDAVAIHIG